MPQMTGQQARVIEPILSEHARGYRQASLIGRMLFPLAPVGQYGGQVIEFDKSSFKLYNSRRGYGAATKRIKFGYQGKPYAIVPSALEAVVPRELMRDASQVPGINLGSRAVNTVLRSITLEHEYNCAQIARNAANYDANHKVAVAKSWNDPTSDPVGDVEAGKEAIRQSIGVRPNTLEIPAMALSALKKHPDLLNRAAVTNIKVVNIDLLKVVFEIENIIIGDGVVAGEDDSFGDIWGEDVVLAYVSAGSDADANAEEPSYGYTYLIEGHPLVEVPYYDNNAKSWVYGVSYDNSPVLSGMTAGFLIQGAGAPL